MSGFFPTGRRAGLARRWRRVATIGDLLCWAVMLMALASLAACLRELAP